MAHDGLVEYFFNDESDCESDSDDELLEFEESTLWESDDDAPEEVADDPLVNPPYTQVPKVENIKWREGAFEPQLFPFDEINSGISPVVQSENNSPLYWFQCFFDTQLMDYIVDQTNLYHASFLASNDPDKRKHQKDWVPVNKEEFYSFLAIVMLMSVVKKATLSSYWSTDPLLATPIFATVMPRDRFLEILRSMHFNDNNKQPSGDRIYKIEPVIKTLREKFKQFVIPYQNLCIDESLMLWKGRLSFKQYIPNKRHRFGVKLFIIVDCKSGTILDFIVYVGSDTDYEYQDHLGISGSIVMTLMEPYLGKGHNLYVDNWYTSPTLFRELHLNKTGACGTVRSNRSGFPKFKKLKRGEIDHLHQGSLLAIKWHDKREVHMLTSINKDGMAPTKKKNHLTNEIVEKPLAVIDYNANMGGVDKSDMQIHFIESVRKTIKWYKKLFFHLLDMTVLNAYNMHRIKEKKRQTLGEFRIELVRQLIEKYGKDFSSERRSTSAPHPKRLIDRHFPSLIPYEKGKTPKQLTCVVCSQSVRKDRKRSKTRYECVDCNVGLCVSGCFKEYHTLSHY